MGVTYYKRISKYEGDITANKSLRCDEVDGNFYFLRGYDINTIGYDRDANELILTRVDGEEVRVDISQPQPEVSFSFDEDTKVLYVTTPDGTKSISEYISAESGVIVAVDGTLEGNGTISNPLRISSVERSGMLAAADEYRDLTEDDTTLTAEMAIEEGLSRGHRILTKEKTSKFGALYNFETVKEVMTALRDSVWRVPTKDDWDKMLTSIEPDPCYDEAKDHHSTASNAWLGEKAGQKLKSTWLWRESSPETQGTDDYGFEALPLGFKVSNDSHMDLVGYKSLAIFWTSTIEDDNEDVWTKRLDYDHADVNQTSNEPENMFALRLVRDVVTDEGVGACESEYIPSLGITVPCTRINTTIWTSCNVLLKQYDGWNAWDDVDVEQKDVKESFYINEWDGKTWVKRQLVDGQTIILKACEDPQQGTLKYHEFITYSNDGGIHVELKDFADFINTQSEERIRNVEIHADENTAAINQLNEQLSATTVELNNKITALEQDLVQANTRISELEAQLDDKIKLSIANILRGVPKQIKLTYVDEYDAEVQIEDATNIKIGFAPDAQFIAD